MRVAPFLFALSSIFDGARSQILGVKELPSFSEVFSHLCQASLSLAAPPLPSALPWLHLWGLIVLLGVVLVVVAVISMVGVITLVLVIVVVLIVTAVIPMLVIVDRGMVLNGALTTTRRITLLIVAWISMVIRMVVRLLFRISFMRMR